MWPFRPDRLTDALSRDDIRLLLQLGDSLGSAVTLIERSAGDEYTRMDPDRAEGERRADPFCTFFRHGRVAGRPAFDGADDACVQCEQKLARRMLNPQGSTVLNARDTGVVALRCHMGLTDYQAPVTVSGKVVASVIAGRRVEAEEDRQRIRKIVGKLGKLTRAEAEIADSGDRLIEPADEKARERLIQEIAAIPSRSEDLERGLARIGQFLGRLAARQFESTRRSWEDVLVERIDSRHGELPRSFGDLRRETSALLDAIRAELGLEYLAFFGVTPKDLDDPDARASLVAESGLGTGTERRLIELDWFQLPSSASGGEGEVARGLAAVSAAIHALQDTKEASAGLKDRLTKCLFLAPVEIGSHLRSALSFGPPKSTTPPEPGDFQFLARIARAVSRRYYALAAELERRWLAEHLATENAARREAEAAKRVLEKTEGFTFFDARKLLHQCLERVASQVEERGVELDTRDCLERVIFRGDRKEVGDVFRRLLEEGIERTLIDPESKKGAPLRVFLKRSRTRLFFGVEAIGDFFGPRERREIFGHEPPQAGPSGRGATSSSGRTAGGSSGRAPAGSSGRGARIPAGNPAPQPAGNAPGNGSGAPEASSGSSGAPRRTLDDELAILRRHEGRLRVDSERLHKWERDRSRWVGKTTFLVDLPLPVRPEPEGAREKGDGARGNEKSEGAREQPVAPAGKADDQPAPQGLQ